MAWQWVPYTVLAPWLATVRGREAVPIGNGNHPVQFVAEWRIRKLGRYFFKSFFS